jgi:hypothetical protein
LTAKSTDVARTNTPAVVQLPIKLKDPAPFAATNGPAGKAGRERCATCLVATASGRPPKSRRVREPHDNQQSGEVSLRTLIAFLSATFLLLAMTINLFADTDESGVAVAASLYFPLVLAAFFVLLRKTNQH